MTADCVDASPVSIYYLVQREALSSIFPAQVLAPLSQHHEGFDVNLGVLTPVGQIARPYWHRRLREVTRGALQQYGLKINLLLSLPSRLKWTGCDVAIVRRWIKRRESMTHPFVVHCRNAEATNVALDAVDGMPSARVIFDCRGDASAEYADGQGLDPSDLDSWPDAQRTRYLEIGRLTERAIRASAHVMCVSNAMRSDLCRRFDLNEEESTVVPCCPDLERFEAALGTREAVRQENGWSDRLVVAYCGSMDWYQMPEQSLRIFRLIRDRVPEAHFLALTTSPHRLREAVNAAGMQETDLTIRRVPQHEVPRLLAAADVGLLLRDDSLVNRVASPLKFGEYLASGTPVVLTRGIGDYSDEVKTHNLGCLVDIAEDDAAVAVCLMRFLNSAQFRDRQVHQRSVEFARRNLGWTTHLPKISACYRRLTSEKRNGRGEFETGSASIFRA